MVPISILMETIRSFIVFFSRDAEIINVFLYYFDDFKSLYLYHVVIIAQFICVYVIETEFIIGRYFSRCREKI